MGREVELRWISAGLPCEEVGSFLASVRHTQVKPTEPTRSRARIPQPDPRRKSNHETPPKRIVGQSLTQYTRGSADPLGGPQDRRRRGRGSMEGALGRRGPSGHRQGPPMGPNPTHLGPTPLRAPKAVHGGLGQPARKRSPLRTSGRSSAQAGAPSAQAGTSSKPSASRSPRDPRSVASPREPAPPSSRLSCTRPRTPCAPDWSPGPANHPPVRLLSTRGSAPGGQNQGV